MQLLILGIAGVAVGAYAIKSVTDDAVKIVIIGGVAYIVAKKAGVI